MGNEDANPTITLADLKILVERANAGEEKAIAQVRRIVDANPQLWQRVGNLAARAEGLLTRAAAGPDVLVDESIRRRLGELKHSLASGDPTPLESLAIERVALAWLELKVLVINAASRATTSPQDERYWAARRHQADRRYQAAIRMLHQLQKASGRRRAGNAESSAPASDSEGPQPAPILVLFAQDRGAEAVGPKKNAS